MSDLSHLDENGRLRMVDISSKQVTKRIARAEGTLVAGKDVLDAVRQKRTPKGNVLEVARVAGILAAKRTADLIPLCHSLPLDHVQVDFEVGEESIRIEAQAVTTSATGVEMEALTAASIAGLTLYDMLKALSKSMKLTDVRLLSKSGGKSGEYAAR